MLLVHIGIALMQLQCEPSTYVNSINEYFTLLFPQICLLFFMSQYNEHVCMNEQVFV